MQRIRTFSFIIAAAAALSCCLFTAGCGGSGSSTTTPDTKEPISNPVPTLTALSVDSALIGSPDLTLSLDGKGFVSGARLRFGSDELTPTTVADAQLTATVPATLLKTAAVVAVTVTNPTPGGGTSNALNFTVKNPVPTVTALSQDAIDAWPETDLALSVTGTNFVSGATVNFGTEKLNSGNGGNQSGRMDVTVPAASLASGAEVSVTVTNPEPGGGTSNALTFRINNPQPQLTAISPASAVASSGDFVLAVSGTGFVPTTVLEFGTGGPSLAPGAGMARGQMSVTIPDAAYANGGVIQVTAVNPGPGGGRSNSIDFTINNPVPAIASSAPLTVSNTGSDVVVSLLGSGFVSSSAVTIGTDTPESVSSSLVSKGQLNITLPAATIATAAKTGSLSINVSNPAPSGGASNPYTLTVLDKAALAWMPIVNNTSVLPGTTTPFASFSGVSINAAGMAAFRGTSILTTSGSGETSSTSGIYTVDLANAGATTKLVDITTFVPQPTNTLYNNAGPKFGTFPSTPYIDASSSFVGFTATHPAIVYLPAGGRGGDKGLYGNPGGTLVTGVAAITSALEADGSTTDYSYFQVPDMPAGTAFGAFPIAPAAVGGNTLVFKGDYLDGTIAGTGIYYRTIGGTSAVGLIASTHSTLMPDNTVRFAYIGAPTAVGTSTVFVGYNRRTAPTAGGIYLASQISNAPALTPLVTIGTPVPGQAETDLFTQFGDNVSFDGRNVAFWGAWGTETTTKHLTCTDNADPSLSAYCLTVFPNGYDAEVPLHQGLFVYDTTQKTLTAIAATGGGFADFAYYMFAGIPPEVPEGTTGGGNGGGGGETEVTVPLESPAFVLGPNVAIVSGNAQGTYQLVFKANTGGVDGLYMVSGPTLSAIQMVLDTTMPGLTVDPGVADTSIIRKIDLERFGMNGTRLGIGSTMTTTNADGTTSMTSGLYAATLPTQ